MILNLINLLKILKLFPKKKLIVSLFVFLNLFNGINYANYQKNDKLKIIFKDKPVINLEIADTDEKRKLGLMYRKHLNRNEGMIFDYKGMNYVKIWMKNTQIPLDILFFASDGRLVNVIHSAAPFSLNARNSAGPARYVLELNGGVAAENDIQLDARLVLPLAGQ